MEVNCYSSPYSALVRLHLVYCVQSGDSQFKRDTAKLRRNQQKADQDGQGPRLQVIQGQVREAGLFSLGD